MAQFFSELDEYFGYNNIDVNNVEGILLRVLGEKYMSFRWSKLNVTKKNEKVIDQVFSRDPINAYLGLKDGEIDLSKSRFKIGGVFEDASVEMYGIGRKGTSIRGSLLRAEGL